MIEVFLIYPTPEGSQEILMERGQLSLGRGSDADLRFDDGGLSRLNSTIFREGTNVWILDENSTNGTLVNGTPVPASGTVLKNGDSVKIGNHTTIRIKIAEKQIAASPPINVAAANVSVASQTVSNGSFPVLPVLIIGFAVLLIGVSVIFIGVKTLGGSSGEEIVEKTPVTASGDFPEDDEPRKTPSPKEDKTPKEEASATPVTTATVSGSTDTTPIVVASGKKYPEMSETEKDQYVKEKSEKIARIIGNQSSEPIPPDAVKTIRNNLQGYVNRVRAGRKETGSCNFGSDMTTTLQRASKNAPFINRAFYAEGIAPEIGLYVAMIESEHCECLESPTHAKGMFQFLASSAPDYGLDPNDRCLPEPSAKAAAKYLKSLTGRFGTGPMSVPLAIASYNSGQGGLSKNLESALRAAAGQERSFWTLVANQVAFEGRIGEQFRRENVKYVPKFFAAAIIGENPQDFGIQMQPLSTYNK